VPRQNQLRAIRISTSIALTAAAVIRSRQRFGFSLFRYSVKSLKKITAGQAGLGRLERRATPRHDSLVGVLLLTLFIGCKLPMKEKRSEKSILEEFIGREIPSEEWERVKPDKGETLNDVAKGLPPRIAEREFEFAATVGAYENVARIVEANNIGGSIHEWAKGRRKALFGSTEPPFGSAEEALEWIGSEHERWFRKASKFEEWMRDPIDQEFRNRYGAGVLINWISLLVWWPGNQLPASRRVPKFWRASMKFRNSSEAAWLICFQRDQARSSKDGPLRKCANWLMTHPDDGFCRAVGPTLTDLARCAYFISRLSQCWTIGETTSFMLTGTLPKIPRFRVWTGGLPGGGKESFIQLFGPLSWREGKELLRIIRKHTGTYGKKALTLEDFELINFVEPMRSRGTHWDDMQLQWNKAHPKRTFKHSCSLQNAYNRAVKKKGRP
jgi:hypothetical protein